MKTTVLSSLLLLFILLSIHHCVTSHYCTYESFFQYTTTSFDLSKNRGLFFGMGANAWNRFLNAPIHFIYNRIFMKCFRTIFLYCIAILFVYLPNMFSFGIRLSEKDAREGKQNRVRARQINPSNPSSPYRALETIDQLQTQIDKKILTLADIPDLCYRYYPDRTTMGTRKVLNVEEEKQANGKIFTKYIMGDYQFITYREIQSRIEAIGRALVSIRGKSQGKILIFSETRREWLLTAFAAFRHNITVVTLLPTLDEEGVKHGINESEVSIIFTSYELISKKIEKVISDIEKVRYIIYYPARNKAEKTTIPIDRNNIQFISIDHFEKQGSTAYIDEATLNQRPEKHHIAVVMYTSGSTGPPKGTSISHENVLAAMTGQKERVSSILDVNTDIYVSYLPLGHILGLCSEMLIFSMGIKYGYSSPYTLTDQSTAIKHGEKGDLQVLRPHLMPCVPTILNRIYKTINQKVEESNYFKRQLFNLVYAIKMKRLEHGLNSPLLDRLVFSRFNQMVLGGRLKAVLSGGAILPEETQMFAEVVLCVTIFQGYGLTETCAAGTIADQYDISIGRAGYPLVSCEIRLLDWEEGHYKTTDKPNPRGEVLIGGKVVAQSYFGRASDENDSFKDIDGTRYFLTGDIGEIFPDGTLKIIDRKKDVVKISNDKYVSLAKVEMAINKISLVDNSCVCASSSKDYTIALICPNAQDMQRLADKRFHEEDWKIIANDKGFNDEILEKVRDMCQDNGVEDFAVPGRIKIVTDSWTPESGLVNDALKLKRKAIAEKYKTDIEQLFQDVTTTESNETSSKVPLSSTKTKHHD